MILIIDNYDSFTYNLYQMVGVLGYEVKVFRNDEISIEDTKEINPEKLILSPGPGYPSTAGVMIDVIKKFHDKIPILGICLGHQGIGEAFGGSVVKANEIIHGKIKDVYLEKDNIFKGIENNIKVVRYHSLVINKNNFPDELKIIATGGGEIMAVAHKKYPVYGLQFHPESCGTAEGINIVKNFLEM